MIKFKFKYIICYAVIWFSIITLISMLIFGIGKLFIKPSFNYTNLDYTYILSSNIKYIKNYENINFKEVLTIFFLNLIPLFTYLLPIFLFKDLYIKKETYYKNTLVIYSTFLIVCFIVLGIKQGIALLVLYANIGQNFFDLIKIAFSLIVFHAIPELFVYIMVSYFSFGYPFVLSYNNKFNTSKDVLILFDEILYYFKKLLPLFIFLLFTAAYIESQTFKSIYNMNRLQQKINSNIH